MTWREQLLALKGDDKRRKNAKGRTWEEVSELLQVPKRTLLDWINPNRTPEPNAAMQAWISTVCKREC